MNLYPRLDFTKGPATSTAILSKRSTIISGGMRGALGGNAFENFWHALQEPTYFFTFSLQAWPSKLPLIKALWHQCQNGLIGHEQHVKLSP